MTVRMRSGTGSAFFVFQAEDGIRDIGVTGVQTCALPIYIYSSIFHIISSSTTTGFQYLNIQSLPHNAKIFLTLIMLVGGTAFSTAGGIKVGRFILLYQELAKASKPKSRSTTATTIAESHTSSSISSTANPYRSTEFMTRLQDEHRKGNLGELVEQQARVLKRISLIMSKKVIREILTVIALYVSVALITGSVLSFLTNSRLEDAMFEARSEEHTSELQSRQYLVCRLLLEKKN